MRTVLRNIICSLICFVLIASPASAQTTAVMQMKWEGDYQENSSPKLIITFKTPANYISQVTGVMYPFNTTDSLSSYVHMTEVTVNGSQEMKIIFKITNSLDAPEGKYKIYLDYCANPEGADFSIWQRQKMIMDWKSSWAPERQWIDKMYCGEVDVTSQSNTLTFRFKGERYTRELEFSIIYLELVED